MLWKSKERFIPIFCGDWSDDKEYENLSIVNYQANSYTSKKYVPKGVDISDSNYWIMTGNYNQQVENYRKITNDLKSLYESINLEIINARGDYSSLLERFLDINKRLLNISDFVINKEEIEHSESYNISIKNDLTTSQTINLDKKLNLTSNGNKLIKDFIGDLLTISGDDVKINDVIIDDLQGDSQHALINVAKVKNLVISELNILNSFGNGIIQNTPESSDIKILNSSIKSNSYSVLIDKSSTSSKDVIISNNNVESLKSDGIALNSPVNENVHPDVSLSNVVVNGNISKADKEGTSNYSGYGVSLADTRNVVISSNVIPNSRNEGCHIEGTERNVIVSSNVFNNSVGNGIGLLNIKRTFNGEEFNGEGVIINGNQITKDKTNYKKDNGIFTYLDINKNINKNIFSNNIIEGFENGIFLNGTGYNMVSHNIIKNCENAIKVYNSMIQLGINLTDNCENLISTNGIGNGSIVDKIYSTTQPSKIINGQSDSNRYLISRGFNFPMINISLNENYNNDIILFEKPKLMQGKLLINIYGNNAQDVLYLICDIQDNGSEIITSNMVSKKLNAFNNKDITFQHDTYGNFILHIENLGSLTDSTFKAMIDFDGYYCK